VSGKDSRCFRSSSLMRVLTLSMVRGALNGAACSCLCCVTPSSVAQKSPPGLAAGLMLLGAFVALLASYS
jgi:hypothetical protein